MQKPQYELGLIGLGTMGRNLLMNMADHGFSVAGYDTDPSRVEQILNTEHTEKISGQSNLTEFIAILKKPKVIMLLVPAGRIVDEVIDEILPFLEDGDIIIDGGNSHYIDTEKRITYLEKKNIQFVGMGISGGAEGARKGPSMMPGGSPESWERIQSIFEAAAAKVDGSPCVSYMGNRSAGHYVKMVHNGIEYGMMELIAEAYDYMRRALGLENEKIADVFDRWNEGKLHSYLIEITAEVFRTRDPLESGDLIDKIRDESKQKGTGKWTSQDAMDLQVPVPGIDLAVAMRDLSGYLSERTVAAEILKGPENTPADEDLDQQIGRLENALYFGFMINFAQGMALLLKASQTFDYGLHPAEIAKIWRGGCIIRAAILEDIRKAFDQNPDLKNIMLDPHIAKQLNQYQEDIRDISISMIQKGIPGMALINVISYFDAYRSPRLPANLIQAQRDFFGAHGFERLDREGVFHADWGKP